MQFPAQKNKKQQDQAPAGTHKCPDDKEKEMSEEYDPVRKTKEGKETECIRMYKRTQIHTEQCQGTSYRGDHQQGPQAKDALEFTHLFLL
ncbi:MAG: hypothetical protein A3D92_06405 [Bacteroidetes bacterium RIFCSPHIGHO2_02_FULL_44_7]|nr:MAG: hypothetical protein A3D92_06405 [Bacteroidetes bacterium RIFCSPHIGHO2_02_FULL_44_7]